MLYHIIFTKYLAYKILWFIRTIISRVKLSILTLSPSNLNAMEPRVSRVSGNIRCNLRTMRWYQWWLPMAWRDHLPSRLACLTLGKLTFLIGSVRGWQTSKIWCVQGAMEIIFKTQSAKHHENLLLNDQLWKCGYKFRKTGEFNAAQIAYWKKFYLMTVLLIKNPKNPLVKHVSWCLEIITWIIFILDNSEGFRLN